MKLRSSPNGTRLPSATPRLPLFGQGSAMVQPPREVARWGSWHIYVSDLHGITSMLACPVLKKLVIDRPVYERDPQLALERAAVHLEEGHFHRRKWTTVADIRAAEGVARIRLDRPQDRELLSERPRPLGR